MNYNRVEIIVSATLVLIYTYHLFHYSVSPDFDGFLRNSQTFDINVNTLIYGGDIYHAPGYQMFLALLTRAFDFSQAHVFFVQAILSIISLLLISRTARRIFDDSIASYTLIICCLLTNLIDYSTAYFKECITIFMMAFIINIYSYLIFNNQNNIRSNVPSIILPFLIFLCLITNPMTLFLFLPLIIHAFYSCFKTNDLLKRYFFISLAILITLYSSFQYRNIKIDNNNFVAFTTNFGVNFYLGHWGTGEEKIEIRKKTNLSESEESKYFTKAALTTIKNKGFKEYISHTLDKIGKFYTRAKTKWIRHKAKIAAEGYKGYADFLSSFGAFVIVFIVIPAAATSISFTKFYSAKQKAFLLALYCSAISLILIPVLFFVRHRFMLPAYPILLVLSAYTIHAASQHLRNKAINSATAFEPSIQTEA